MRGWLWIGMLAALAGCAAAMAQQRQNDADMAGCDRGDPPSCLRVGRMWRGAALEPLRPEDDVSQERMDALIAYDRACGSGVREACVEGTELFAAGVSAYETAHPEVLVRLEGGACQLGDDARCLVIAKRLVGPDPQRAALVRLVCGRSVGRCLEAAQLIWDHDRAVSLELAWQPCKLRAADDCSRAAAMAFEDRDRDALLAASCELHTANDCFELGNREARTPAMSDEALEHYRLACKLDHAEACVKVGELKSRP